jgi:hypothetical protein
MNPQTPGWKTTEFWLTIFAVAIGFLATAGLFEDGSRWSVVLGFVQTALVTAGYTIARGLTKSGLARATAAVEVARLTSGSYAPAPPLSPAEAEALRQTVAAIHKDGYAVMPQSGDVPTRPLHRP